MSKDYLEGQKKSGIKIGNRVRVIRKAFHGELGWESRWNMLMDDCVGEMGIVTGFCYGSGFQVKIENKQHWNFPYYVLEVINEEEITSYKQALIQFMELKNEHLPFNYFVSNDRDAIESWTEESAKGIWEEIEWNRKKLYTPGLFTDNCPFCIINDNNCSQCEYAATHGDCNGLLSTWREISFGFKKDFEWGELFDRIDSRFKRYKYFIKLLEDVSENDSENTLYLYLDEMNDTIRLCAKEKNEIGSWVLFDFEQGEPVKNIGHLGNGVSNYIKMKGSKLEVV